MTPIKGVALGIPVLLVLIQLVGPARTNPPELSERTVESRLVPTPRVQGVLNRSCSNCHSHRTVWPWYSRVAPVSWFVIDHVNFGRSHLNLSDWARYDSGKSEELLALMCELTKEGEMPLAPYLWMHEEAELSAEDVEELCRWTAGERARLADAETATDR